MIDENRFQRLEDKVDDVQESVHETRADMRIHMSRVEEHIAGDKKIIDKISPVLDKLPTIVEMAEKHHFEKKLRKKAIKSLGLVGMLVGIVAGISKIL